MKNKSKLQKIQKGRTKTSKVPAEWLYLVPEVLELRKVYEIFTGGMPWTAEYWEEAGVLEIAVPEAGSVDLEELTELDEYLEAYMAEHQLKTVFAVTLVPENYEKVRKVMEKIMDCTGGTFCGDTDDFTPRLEMRKK